MKEKIDIISNGETEESRILSNFSENEFFFDGVRCAGMEGFLQSLKYICPKKQRQICALSGKTAKKAGTGKKRWKITGGVYWKGKRYYRLSVEYLELILRAYRAMYRQNERFRKTLDGTRGKILCHSIGNPNPKDTILTEKEFIFMLCKTRSLGL